MERRERQRNAEVERVSVKINVGCKLEKKYVEGTLVKGSQAKSCDESVKSLLEIYRKELKQLLSQL